MWGLILAAFLVWDTPTSGSVAGYVVHYGNAAGVYTKHVDVGTTKRFDLNQVTLTGKIWMAVTAYNDGGQSPNSPEVIATLGPITAPQNPRLE